MTRLRLGVNIDHVATIRNARGGQFPDPVRAAKLAAAAGADGLNLPVVITADGEPLVEPADAELASRVGETVNIVVLSGQEALYLDQVAGPSALPSLPSWPARVTLAAASATHAPPTMTVTTGVSGTPITSSTICTGITAHTPTSAAGPIAASIASAEDIARICHAHPSLSEVTHEAALAVDKRALHM